MGRKRIYITDEEKRAANRAKSKRYYHRRKAGIVRGQRIDSENIPAEHSQQNPSTLTSGGSPLPYRKSDPLEIWMEHAERLKRRVVKITEDAASPAKFVDRVCREFMYTLDAAPLKALAKKCSDILAALNHCHSRVLQLAQAGGVGVGPGLESINEAVQSVRELIGWIGEIECVIVIDPREVLRMYADIQFVFQEIV